MERQGRKARVTHRQSMVECSMKAISQHSFILYYTCISLWTHCLWEFNIVRGRVSTLVLGDSRSCLHRIYMLLFYPTFFEWNSPPKKSHKKRQVKERNFFSALAFPKQISQIQRMKSTPAVTQLGTEKKVLQPPELQPGTPGAKSRVYILPAVGRCSHLSGQQQAWLEVGPCFQNKNKILQLSPHLKTSVSKITHGEGKDSLQSSG